MKITQGGKRYDTERCEEIASRDLYSYNNNYAGTRSLYRAKDGQYLIYQETNGQDFNIRDEIYLVDGVQSEIDKLHLTEAQEKRCAELGIIEII